VLLTVVLAVSAGPSASASPDSEFVSRTNGARSSYGVGAYAVRSELAAVARRQAGRMAAAHTIYHNGNLGNEVSNWRSIGENVGMGGSVSAIHNAFMNSSEHRSNILSTSFTEVGIGTARGSDGQLYVSEVFRRPTGATYVAPRPKRTVVRRTPARASRSAPRKPLVVPKAPPRKPAVRVVPATVRINAAWRLYRKSRPVGALDLAVTYLRTGRILLPR
jgi:hypothetical protein